MSDKKLSNFLLKILFTINILVLSQGDCAEQNFCEIIISKEDSTREPRATYCVFYDIQTTEDNPLFHPNSSDSKFTPHVEFHNSQMHTLTDELCIAFPSLRILKLEHLAMHKIKELALALCKNLMNVSFYNNSLGVLDVPVFKSTQPMQYLTFTDNKLTKISPIILEGLNELTYFSVHYNFLIEFPVHKIRQLFRLNALLVSENNLTDLDEQELIYKFPNLTSIQVASNRFDCDRLKTMLGTFRRNKILVKDIHDGEQMLEGNCIDEKERIKDQIDSEVDDINEELEHIKFEVETISQTQTFFNETLIVLNETLYESMPVLTENLDEIILDINSNKEKINSTFNEIARAMSELTTIGTNINDHEERIRGLINSAKKLDKRIQNLQNNTIKNQKRMSELKSVLNNKTDVTKKIHSTSLIIFSTILVIATIVIPVLINLLFCRK